MDQRLAEARGLAAAGRAGDALAILEALLDEAPDSAELHYQHAALAPALGLDAADAEDSLVMALHYDPGHASAALAFSDILESRGALGQAVEVLQAALARTARDDLAVSLARNLRASGRRGEAIEALRTAKALSRDTAPLDAMMALLLFESGDVVAAESLLRAVLVSDPQCVEAIHNLALVRFHAADLDEARALVSEALALRNGSVPSRSLLGHIERDSGRIPEALECYAECLRLDPGFDDARINRCYALLLDGRFEEGWAEYARRFTLDAFPPRGLPFPEWNGQNPRGEHMLVYAEQGIGDEIMFSSCLPDLRTLGARITLECNSRLAPLFARSFPGIDVHGMAKSAAPDWARALKGIRWQVAIGDLPRFFRQGHDRYPPDARGYLRADPVRIDFYRREVEQISAGRRVVAFAWRGGDWLSGTARRSLNRSELAHLLSDRAALWISVQHGDVDEDLRWLRKQGADVVHWPEAVTDLDAMAALMRAVHEVICVDNTVAHLAGALGIPVRILLSAAPEWRYGLAGDRMPWYPGAMLYRQTRLGHWSPVLERLKRDLAAAADGMPGTDSA